MEDQKSNKAMLITVGTGKTREDVAHGIAVSIRNVKPDHVLFFASNESTETIQHVIRFCEECVFTHEIITIPTIEDFQKLHFFIEGKIEELDRNGFSRANIVSDYTSGTKAMSAAMVSASLESEVADISYVSGERKYGAEGGVVSSGTEKVYSLSPLLIRAEKKLKTFYSYFNKYQFTACIELLNPMRNQTDVQAHFPVQFLYDLTRLIKHWDMFLFNQAKNIAAAMLKNHTYITESDKQKIDLTLVEKTLIELDKRGYSFAKVIDLLANAGRRAEEGKYDDASARLYRVLEMVGQVEFNAVFSCDTNSVDPAVLPEKIKASFIKNYSPNEGKHLKLPLTATYIALGAAGNKIGKKYERSSDRILTFTRIRNNSILAHGSVPVQKADYENLRTIVVDFI